jgi:hypothetical protein
VITAFQGAHVLLTTINDLLHIADALEDRNHITKTQKLTNNDDRSLIIMQ